MRGIEGATLIVDKIFADYQRSMYPGDEVLAGKLLERVEGYFNQEQARRLPAIKKFHREQVPFYFLLPPIAQTNQFNQFTSKLFAQ